MPGGGDTQDLYREYRLQVEQERLPSALRLAVVVLFVIQTVFIFVDWLIFPEKFSGFLPVRLGLDVALAGVYFWGAKRCPREATFFTCLAGGAMLLTVTQGTGGASSGYYVGLVLLFVGVGVLVPLNGRQACGVIGLLYVSYGLLPILGSSEVAWEVFGLHLFFLGAAGFEGVASAELLDRMRFGDFRQRREIEEARDHLREMDRAKSRFTANVHHELRTPLTLLLAPLEALLSRDTGEVSERVRGELETMRANGTRLLKLINDLLELSRLENDARRLRRQPLKVGERVQRLVDDMQPLAQRKELDLSTRGLEGLGTAAVDPDALERVVVNLLGNAVKFTPERGNISVTGSRAEDGIVLEVADSGVGIPADQLEKVFDRFGQVDTSATRKHEGTGIGLSLAKELVELHGGWVRAESPGVGQGTRMQVYLPVGGVGEAEAEEALLATESRTSEGGESAKGAARVDSGGSDPSTRLVEATEAVTRWEGASGRGETAPAPEAEGREGAAEVLVVEDNDAMRRLLASILSSEFRVRVARNGREALESIRERNPSLVLTDIMMPEVSGTELCRTLKEDAETQGIPVVLVTSKAEREMQIEGLELGADDYVVKPFHPRELSARVRSLVRLHELQVELAGRAAELEKAIAELKETEVQLVQAEKMSAVGELAAGVAHEVNNPLNFARNSLSTLGSYADELAKVARRVTELDVNDPEKLRVQLDELEREKAELSFEDLSSDLRELAGIVGQGLDRTARLVGDLRDFASPHRGERVEVDLAVGLRSTLELVGHRLRGVGAEVEESIAPDVPWVLGEAGSLNQVFLNLLKNAGEAIEEKGGGRISVRARREGPEAVVRVEDDGPGMKSEVRERLFEPFFTTKSAGRGSGLGLSICRRIVEEHGGRMEVESEPGGGTAVTVRFPAGEAHAA